MRKTVGMQDGRTAFSHSVAGGMSPLKPMLVAAAIGKLRREGRPLPNGPIEPFAVLSSQEIARVLSSAGIEN